MMLATSNNSEPALIILESIYAFRCTNAEADVSVCRIVGQSVACIVLLMTDLYMVSYAIDIAVRVGHQLTMTLRWTHREVGWLK